MNGNTLPNILTTKEVAEYLKVSEDFVLKEIENGRMGGFKIGTDWRSTDDDLISYMQQGRAKIESIQPQIKTYHKSGTEWNIVPIEPFVFKWPKQGGGVIEESYDQVYEATKTIDEKEYTFKIGFGNRQAAAKMRRRVTIWLGNRAIVEFAGSNNYQNDGLLAGIIRLKNGKQLATQRIPEEYRGFRLEKYNSIVVGPRASTNLAVVVHKDDLKSMLEHAVIRASWKELI